MSLCPNCENAVLTKYTARNVMGNVSIKAHKKHVILTNVIKLQKLYSTVCKSLLLEYRTKIKSFIFRGTSMKSIEKYQIAHFAFKEKIAIKTL